MMYGAKHLTDLIFSGSEVRTTRCQWTDQTERHLAGIRSHQAATIQANWQALSEHHFPSVPVHVPAPLPAPSSEARPVIHSESELDALHWLAMATVKASLKRRAYGRAKNKVQALDHGHKLRTMNVAASQLWPAEIKLAQGFQLVSNKRGDQQPDFSKMSLEALIGSQGSVTR